MGITEPSVGREMVCSEITRDYGYDGCVDLGLEGSVSNASIFWSMVSSELKRPHDIVELKIVVLALQGFGHLVVGRSVLIQSDN